MALSRVGRRSSTAWRTSAPQRRSLVTGARGGAQGDGRWYSRRCMKGTAAGARGGARHTEKERWGRRSPAMWRRRAMRKKRSGDGKKHLSCGHVVFENPPQTVITKNSIVLCSLCFMHSMI